MIDALMWYDYLHFQSQIKKNTQERCMHLPKKYFFHNISYKTDNVRPILDIWYGSFNKFCRKSVEKEFCRRNSQPAKKTDA